MGFGDESGPQRIFQTYKEGIENKKTVLKTCMEGPRTHGILDKESSILHPGM